MCPWQHALDDGLAAVGELPDHRGVALGRPMIASRIAVRSPVYPYVDTGVWLSGVNMLGAVNGCWTDPGRGGFHAMTGQAPTQAQPHRRLMAFRDRLRRSVGSWVRTGAAGRG
jgi:hypothetical protein